MNALDEKVCAPRIATASHNVKLRMLRQMAEALEDEAAGLYRRAASLNEEEFLLNRQVEERHTEINRLQLKLESLRSERDGLLNRVEQIRSEAAAMREEVYNSEEELAISSIDTLEAPKASATSDGLFPDKDDPTRQSIFFQRISLT